MYQVQIQKQYPSHQITLLHQDQNKEVYKLTSDTKTFAVKIQKYVNYDELKFLDLMFRSKVSPMLEVYKHSNIEYSLYQTEYQYFEGGTLEHLTQNLEISDIDLIIEQIGQQLEFIHENGYVYQDFKPSNIIFGNNSNIRDSKIFKIYDFTNIEKTYRTDKVQQDILLFGTLICELLSQKTLYEGENLEEIVKTNEELKQNQINIRKKINQTRGMIERMLDPNPNNRPRITEVNQFFRNNSIYLNQKKRVILIGNTGSGKTTLFNRLTGAKELTMFGGWTVTRELVQGLSIYDTNFEVIDVPDLQFIEKGLLQVAGQMAGIQLGDINQIILVIQYDNYYENMRSNINQYIKLFERYLEKITIYISKFDRCKSNEELKEEQTIRDWIFKKFQIKSIMFYKKNLSDESITIQITNIVKSSNSITVEIDENQILNDFQFNLQNDDDNKDFNLTQNLRNSMIKEFYKFSNQTRSYLYNVKQDNPHYLQILEIFRYEGRKQLEELFDKQTQILSEQMNCQLVNGELNYTPFILLLQSLNQELRSFSQTIDEKQFIHSKFMSNWTEDLTKCNNKIELITFNQYKHSQIFRLIEKDKIKFKILIKKLIGNRKIIPKIIK